MPISKYSFLEKNNAFQKAIGRDFFFPNSNTYDSFCGSTCGPVKAEIASLNPVVPATKNSGTNRIFLFIATTSQNDLSERMYIRPVCFTLMRKRVQFINKMG